MLWLEEWLKGLREEMSAVTDEEISTRDSEREELSESDHPVGTMNDELIRFAVVRSRRLRQYGAKIKELMSSFPNTALRDLEKLKNDALSLHGERETLSGLFWLEVEKQFPATRDHNTCLRRGGTVVWNDDPSQIESCCVIIDGPFSLKFLARFCEQRQRICVALFFYPLNLFISLKPGALTLGVVPNIHF